MIENEDGPATGPRTLTDALDQDSAAVARELDGQVAVLRAQVDHRNRAAPPRGDHLHQVVLARGHQRRCRPHHRRLRQPLTSLAHTGRRKAADVRSRLQRHQPALPVACPAGERCDRGLLRRFTEIGNDTLQP